jgi:glycerate-2-kinase
MALRMEEILAPLELTGLAVVKEDFAESKVPRGIAVRAAAHPVPDRRSVQAAKDLMALARQAGEDDLALVLLSGGGSALAEIPSKGLTLEDLQGATDMLLRSGADIRAMNTVRKHCSDFKGGGLARALHPAIFVTLAISDVVGNAPDVISSGPTCPDTGTFAEALSIARDYTLPANIVRHLELGAAGLLQETAKPSDEIFKHLNYFMIGDNSLLARAAAGEAARLGYRVIEVEPDITGEASHVAAAYARKAAEYEAEGPACYIGSGETTVRVKGGGLGGRCQAMAMRFALEARGVPCAVFLAAGSDGSDGPTDAAGAVASGRSLDRAESAGLNWEKHMRDDDSYRFFEALGGHITTGPTGTNVNDLYVTLLQAPHRRNEW